MRKLLFAFVILLGCGCYIRAQEQKGAQDAPALITLQDDKRLSAFSEIKAENFFAPKNQFVQNASVPASTRNFENQSLKVESEIKPIAKEKEDEDTKIFNAANQERNSLAEGKDRFHWKPALIQSAVFLGIQHGFRMTQKKTRRELGGPFFRDWSKSVKGLEGWNDSDNFFTNYVAHPLQGGLTGRIFINNSDRAKRQEFGKSKQYWETRLKAMAWSAVWSTQFELGPISEASLGNVGQHKKRGQNTMAWTDLVVTPVLGTGVVILEDAIDKFILKNWLERKITNKLKIKAFRIVFTPTSSVSNLLRLRRPSWRDYR